jgi:hypothetical protein
MRVLALGAFDVPYIRDNWADALRHVLKDDVTCVNASAWLACAPPEAHMKVVYRLIATGAYDYLFVYHDYIAADYSDDFFAHVRGAGLKTIAFHPDDEPEVWYQRNRVYDGRFDLVASHAQRGVARRLAERRPTRPLYLPWGFNQRFFDRASEAVRPVYDVVFVGKHKVHDHDSTVFREDGRHRDDLLQAVATICDRRGWRFGLFGYGWERHPALSRYAGGVLSQQEMVRTYHASRIVLNPAWTADEERAGSQTKLRHFEVAGCGAFQLTNTNDELGELLEPGREIAFFSDTQDLCEQISRFLERDAERQAVADAGYRAVHAAHTLDHRVRTLFGEAASIWPPKQSVERSRPMPRVKTIQIRSRDELRAVRDDLARTADLSSQCDAVHIAACDGVITATNYDALRDWWRADVPVFAGRSHYKLPGCARNPLQPQRSELLGGFLAEHVQLGSLPASHRDRLPEHLLGVSDGDRTRFLINHIARPSAVLALIDAVLRDDAAAFDALAPLPTGVVFTEVELALPRPVAVKGRPVPSYAEPLRAVLRQAAALDQRVAIYGARGDMAETVFEMVRATDRVRLVALFDRSMAGREIDGVPIYGTFDLPTVAPDVVLIAAAYSGPAIYEQLKPLEPQMALVPLYDLRAPAWNVLVPQQTHLHTPDIP